MRIVSTAICRCTAAKRDALADFSELDWLYSLGDKPNK